MVSGWLGRTTVEGLWLGRLSQGVEYGLAGQSHCSGFRARAAEHGVMVKGSAAQALSCGFSAWVVES